MRNFQECGLVNGQLVFNSLSAKVPGLDEYSSKKLPAPVHAKAALVVLRELIKVLKPACIVINDEAALRVLTNEKYSLSRVAGSLYWFENIPCLVLTDLKMLHAAPENKFIFQCHLKKVARWANGTQEIYPSFNFKVVETLQELEACETEMQAATMISVDSETAFGQMTCVGYTYNLANGTLRTICVPFYDPDKPGGLYWKKDEMFFVLLTIKRIHQNKVAKSFQNGTYDEAWFIRDCVEAYEYWMDTQTAMHSLFVELPKALHESCSYFLDNYTYWKDEAKGIKEDVFGKTRDSVLRYWRYNGLDTYYQWLLSVHLLRLLRSYPWAIRNYAERHALSIGPCLAASLRGVKWDKGRHAKIMGEKLIESNAGKADLVHLTGDADYNVNAPRDNAWFLYDVLGQKPTRIQRANSKLGPRSTDEKVLKLMKERGNIFVTNFVNRLLAAKKPGTILSKYGNYQKMTLAGRFMTWFNAAATVSSRFNSGECQFWIGSNAQNIDKPNREMFVADDDYILLDIDYSASDDRFIAYESQDPDKMALVESDKDPHCYHAAAFFQKPYEDIYAGWKAKEKWVTHATEGVRQNTKRVTHGRNFRMEAFTLYNTMGREAVVSAAIMLGYANASGYTDKQLVGICQILIDKYDHPKSGLYKRLRPWQREISELARNEIIRVLGSAALKWCGGFMTTVFGFTRIFFGNVETEHKTQRDLSAQYGQADTAGNINHALEKIYYLLDDGKKVIFHLQVHDNLVFQIHKSALHMIPRIIEIMEEPVTIHGRSVVIPIQAEVGLTWGENLLKWTPDITYEDVVAFEKKTFLEPSTSKDGKVIPAKYPKGSDMSELLKMLGNMNLDGSTDEELPEDEQEDVDAQPDDKLVLVSDTGE